MIKMMLNILLISFLLAGSFGGCTQIKKDIDKGNSVKREYKLLLDGKLFSDRISGYEKVTNILINNFSGTEYRIKPDLNRKNENKSSIEYLDTKEKALFKHQIILKKEVKNSGNAEVTNLSLKMRYENCIIPGMEFRKIKENYNTKAEDDILIHSDNTDSVKQIHSLKFDIDESNSKIKNAGDVINIFPFLSEYKFNTVDEITPVNNIKITEYKKQIGRIYWDDDIKSNVEITVWYMDNDSTSFIAEISYKVKIPAESERNTNIIKKCDSFLIELYKNFPEASIAGKTKTDLIYY
jgi:hypothetical protein